MNPNQIVGIILLVLLINLSCLIGVVYGLAAMYFHLTGKSAPVKPVMEEALDAIVTDNSPVA